MSNKKEALVVQSIVRCVQPLEQNSTKSMMEFLNYHYCRQQFLVTMLDSTQMIDSSFVNKICTSQMNYSDIAVGVHMSES